MSSSKHYVGEDTVHHRGLHGEVDNGLFLAVVNSGELSLLRLLLDNLHFLHHLGRDVLGGELRVVHEECLAVYVDSGYILAVCGDGSVRADLDSREF